MTVVYDAGALVAAERSNRRLWADSLPGVKATLERLLQDVALVDLAGCVAVFRDRDLRIRRPTTD